MARTGQHVSQGRVCAAAGELLASAFLAFIGVPMLVEACTPKPPPNPSTCRHFEPPSGIPVFPGTEGFEARTPAGRGGKATIEVPSLADHGPGTLRAAFKDHALQIIDFRAAGIIELEETLASRRSIQITTACPTYGRSSWVLIRQILATGMVT